MAGSFKATPPVPAQFIGRDRQTVNRAENQRVGAGPAQPQGRPGLLWHQADFRPAEPTAEAPAGEAPAAEEPTPAEEPTEELETQ